MINQLFATFCEKKILVATPCGLTCYQRKGDKKHAGKIIGGWLMSETQKLDNASRRIFGGPLQHPLLVGQVGKHEHH